MAAFHHSIYFHTNKPILEVVEILSPLLKKWIGPGYTDHYRHVYPWYHYQNEASGFSITIEYNAAFGKGGDDTYSFNHVFGYSDFNGALDTEAEYKLRMTEVLVLLWIAGIPTCSPDAESYPFDGGELGPVPWKFD